MRYFFGLGLAAAMAIAPGSALGQTRGQDHWGSSFLGQTNQYVAQRLDEPSAPEVDPATLPTAAMGSGAAYGPAPMAYGDSYGGFVDGGGYGAPCADGSCGYGGGCVDGSCAVQLPSVCCGWYGGVYGLIMTVDDDFDTYLSFDGARPAGGIMRTSDADLDFGGGVQATIGRYLNDCWGVEATYWGFFPDDSEYTLLNTATAGGLYGAIGYDGLVYDAGAGGGDRPVLDYYGDNVAGVPSQAHRIRRNFEAHNVEINLVRNPCRRGGCVHFELLAGFRYLQLDDGLLYSSAFTDPTFGNAPNTEINHLIDVRNQLAGFQVGGRADRYFCGCWGVHLGTKFGIYNNHITHRQRIYGGNGNARLGADNTEYDFRYEDDDIAFVGELFAGLSYDISCNWRLTGGYRAIAACGVARATSQFARDREYLNYTRVQEVDSSDCLLLHGAYFGVEYNW